MLTYMEHFKQVMSKIAPSAFNVRSSPINSACQGLCFLALCLDQAGFDMFGGGIKRISIKAAPPKKKWRSNKIYTLKGFKR